MSHPLLGFPPHQRRRLFGWALGLTIIAAVTLQVMNGPLKTTAAPYGIVSFELARTPTRTAAILQSWDVRAHLYAAFGLGFDYLFMVAYTSAIALAALAVREGTSPWMARLGMAVAWAIGLAGLADAVENALLWRLLLQMAPPTYPSWAWLAATIKFTIITLALLYLLAAYVVRLRVRGRGR